MQGSKQETLNQPISERSEETSAPIIETGTVLSHRFLLQELLGEGGMGRIYKALDLRREEVQDPNPYVAIKLLNESIRSMAGAGIALQREAVIAQRLQHNHIASVYDYNRDEVHAYIVMELIEGYTLDQLVISDYPDGLPAVQSFKIITELIETVSFAHQQGVVHADIKPSNIKIMPSGNIKVMDFGLARVMSLMNMTQHSEDKGVDSQWRHRSLNDAITPSYATRARLHGRQPTKVDDTFALACVIYLILTGRHPYQRMNADKALKQGIKPSRPSKLTKKQWTVLQRALDPNINKNSRALNDLSSALCTRKRKEKHQARKRLSAAAIVFVCASVLPLHAWFNEQFPVWKIRYSDNDKQVEQLTNYAIEHSPEKQKTLEKIYLPSLVEGWSQRWTMHESLLVKPPLEQKILTTMLQRDLLISDLLTPFFMGNKQFSESKTQLEAVRSKYLIEVLMDYNDQLSDYLTDTQPVLASDFLNIYNHTRLLEMIAGSSELIQADPRLNQLLRQSMNKDWAAGRYFPLGEKLKVASAIFSEAPDITAAMGELRQLQSREGGTLNDSPKYTLFSEVSLSDEKPISLMYLSLIERLVKEIKIASSNQLELNPVYLDLLDDVHTRFLLLEGDEYRWKRLLFKADLEYGRSLVRWGQAEKAFQLADKALTAQLRL